TSAALADDLPSNSSIPLVRSRVSRTRSFTVSFQCFSILSTARFRPLRASNDVARWADALGLRSAIGIGFLQWLARAGLAMQPGKRPQNAGRPPRPPWECPDCRL